MIFDWQRATSWPVFTDVAYFIGTSVRESDQATYADLLDSYLSALEATGHALPSHDEIAEMISVGSLSSLLIRLYARAKSIEPWIRYGFEIEDGNWGLSTIIRCANFVDVTEAESRFD